ncbi:MAG: xylanase, partial [Lachnospiraceae bacterium]|nr:xylanase [Lachnospiraceae bacterium]
QHGYCYSDAYCTVANIGLDYAWMGQDVGQREAAERLQHFLGVTRRENPYMTYKIDGELVDQPALHPVGMLAATAQGTLAIPEPLDAENL